MGHALLVAFLAGAVVVSHYTHARMGMARHMVYLRGKWSDALPVEALRIAGVVLVALVCVALVVWCLRAAGVGGHAGKAAGTGAPGVSGASGGAPDASDAANVAGTTGASGMDGAPTSCRRPALGVLASLVVLVALSVLYGWYTLGVDPQLERAHILVSPLLGLAALVQAINVAVVAARR